jgi:hypothetical protein
MEMEMDRSYIKAVIIAKKALEWNPRGGRRKGRPRIAWRSTVRMEAENQGKN